MTYFIRNKKDIMKQDHNYQVWWFNKTTYQWDQCNYLTQMHNHPMAKDEVVTYDTIANKILEIKMAAHLHDQK